jgi:hypothetical protein
MRSPREKFLRSSFRCFVCLIFILGIPTVLGFASAVSNYKGVCHGFQGNEYPCTFGQSVNDYLLSWFLLTFFLPPIPCFFWGIAFGRWITPVQRLRPAISVILTAVIAIITGVLGFYISFYFLLFLGSIVSGT